MIDAHHHFWRYNNQEYAWITPEMSALRRDFGPRELEDACGDAGVRGAVSVQARTSLAETEMLLAHAAANPLILGVVGWFDLKDPKIAHVLESYAAHPLLKGAREVCQGMSDAAYLDNRAFDCGIKALEPHQLSYDLLIYADQLEAATRLVDRHPRQPFVINHCGKPSIRRGAFPDAWVQSIQDLARRPHVWCKLSGLVTEVQEMGGAWDVALLQPYFDAVLAAFGPQRIMFGSDWPVSLLGATYQRWVDAVSALVAPLTPAERFAILDGAATEFYRLPTVA